MHNNSSYKKGYTLVEALFSVAIFSMLILAVTMLARNVWVYNAFVTAGLNNIDTTRKALKTMTSELRAAANADNGSYTIELATPTAFTFYSDIDHDGYEDRVRYFLSGGSLQKGVIKPTGSPLSYLTSNEKVYTVIPTVTNTNIFDYYDKNYDGTTAALPSPITIASIRLIKITVNIDKDPNRAPVATTFSTQISLRNLKDNL